MSRGDAAWYVLAVAWTFAPMYATEKLADYFFLADNTASFYFMSGWRLILFIAFALTGSVAAGAALGGFWKACTTQLLAVASAMALFFYLCDPRVCFSAGLDGLEPLRLGFFLAAVAFSGAGLGVSLRRGRVPSSARFAAGFSGLAAVGFYPVVFTFAGTRLIPPYHPWASAAILAIAAFPVAASAALEDGSKRGALVPLLSMGALVLVSIGIAAAYLQSVSLDAAVLVLAVTGATVAGVAWARFRRSSAVGHRRKLSGLVAAGVALVLVMMLFTTPDAVNGIVPSPGTDRFQQGVPVYAGASMLGPAGHAEGAGVTVSFAGTDPSSIEEDNYLSVGMGIHAAGCCVDGVDYSYRYDLFLFSSGNVSMVASAWEVCDDNAACGGHSWKALMFLRSADLGAGHLDENFTLRVAWTLKAGVPAVGWTYLVAGGLPRNFTSFTPPAAENHDFNTGVLPGGSASQSASYFFQFGVMSGYPIGRGGWVAKLWCPSLLTAGWECIDHAETLQGGQSYWKIFWRWGEDYGGVSVTSRGTDEVLFSYSGGSTPSFRTLW